MTLLSSLLYPQVILTVWGPLLIFVLARASHRWRASLSPRAGFWLSLSLLLLPALMWFVPYLPHIGLREALPYRVPIAWGVYNNPLGQSRVQWWLMTAPALLGLGSMLLAALYGLAEQLAARWRMHQLPQRREGQIIVLDVAGELGFTLGVVRPKVYLSQAVWEGTHRDAVLAHELGHVQARHPMWLALARWSRRSLWLWQPAGALLGEVQVWAELVADQAAVRQAGKPALARALQDIMSQSFPATALPFASAATLTRRVQYLVQPGRSLSTGVAILLILLYLVLLVLV